MPAPRIKLNSTVAVHKGTIDSATVPAANAPATFASK